jgi:protease-4
MTDNKRGFIAGLFVGLWNTVNFARRLVFNVIFVVIVVAVLVALFAARPTLEPRTALVLDPVGAIVEQYSIAPSERALASLGGEDIAEVQLRDLLEVIDTAATDARIERIVLVPDDIRDVGLAAAREIGRALDRFRAGGKEVVAVSNGMNQKQYLLAAHADRILLDPEGSVLLEGLSNYRSYFKAALDKLGVDVHLIKVGAFKSAAEPFVLDQASDAAKQADRYWMGGLWQGYLDEVATLRKLDAGALAADIAHYDERIAAHGGDLAALALEQKLVDELATRSEARARLRERGVADASGTGFRQVAFTEYLAQMSRETLPQPGTAAVAVVVAQGEILPGDQPQGVIGGTSTAQLLREAREDDAIKAVVLRVDSPGGDATASELIRREVVETRAAGKPVLVSMGNVAASGGYWIAMDGDRIFAEPDTITGSIGIFGLIPTIPEALDKLGIHTDGIGTTPLAGALDIRRPLSPQVESILTSVIERGYRQFIGKVAAARKQTPEQIDAIAQGRVWTGEQALQRGLVDELGGLSDTVAAAAARAKLGDDYRVEYIEPELSMLESLAFRLGNSEAFVNLVRRAGFTWPVSLAGRNALQEIAPLLRALDGRPYGVFAHCLCGVR